MRVALLLLLLALSQLALAQSQLKTQVSPAFFFRQRVDVTSFAGKPYRLSVRMKVASPLGDSADANVFSVVLDKNNKYLPGKGDFGRMRARRRDGQWRTYSNHGQLPATATTLAVSGQVYLNGIFGFDDFRVEV